MFRIIFSYVRLQQSVRGGEREREREREREGEREREIYFLTYVHIFLLVCVFPILVIDIFGGGQALVRATPCK